MYSKILVALDGSNHSLVAADIAIALARKLGSGLVAVHIYDAGLHSRRLTEMEPFLPPAYQQEETITHIREIHGHLILDGFESLSKGYMDRIERTAHSEGVGIEKVHRQGRNYVKILELSREYGVDLLVLGAHGLADAGDNDLGSTAARVLRLASCDVLLARQELKPGKILVGIDGSREALSALQKGALWARAFHRPLDLAAVYDPHFHYQVFNTMADSLTQQRQEEVGLAKQKFLHEELIDKGLAKLYEGFLKQAHAESMELGVEAEQSLLRGKAYRALLDYAKKAEVDLIAVGRYGHHREDVARIGSNSETIARLTKTNILVTKPMFPSKDASSQESSTMEWEDQALDRLKRIPSFARAMAKQGIENHARSKNLRKVTLKDVEEVAERLGMMPRKETDHE